MAKKVKPKIKHPNKVVKIKVSSKPTKVKPVTKQKSNSTKVLSKNGTQSVAEPKIKLKELPNKLILEYIIHAAQHLLYEFLTSPSGLSEWFADDVNINGNIYTFIWDGSQQQARVLDSKEDRYIRLQWLDRKPEYYFEFRIDKNDLTEELSLIITDFAESLEDKDSLETLWQGQVQQLMHVIGSKA